MALVARLGLALLLALHIGACSLVGPTSSRSNAAPTPTRHVLANGIPVIVQEHRGSDVVALQLWVKAGGRDETASELGLAHYLEHLLFKGTPSRPGGFIEREVEGAGGRMNAGTSWDYTYYHTVLPARRAAAGIEMLADVAVNASLDASTLDAEKQIVLEEMRLNDDSPRRFLSRQLYSLAFDGHPYGRPLIGTPPLIHALTRETLVAFYRRHYVPESFALVVVGAVSPEEVLTAAAATLGRVPRSGARRLPSPSPPALRAQRVEITRPGAHAHLGLAWAAPRLDHGDTPAVDLLVSILGQSRSSRLVQALRERLGVVHGVSASYSALEAAGLVTIAAELDPPRLAEVEREIVAQVRRIRDEGVTEAELRRAITAAEASHEFSTETAEGRARALGQAETVWRLEEELAYVGRVRTVTAEQIRMVARRYLDPERYTRLALVPPAS